MRFLTIVATVFYGGILWVGADYYIEFQGQPMVTNVRGRSSLTTYLYSCEGIPQGTRAFETDESECEPIDSRDDKITIYANHNFYSAFRSNLQGHRIHFYDRGYISLTSWWIGYSDQNIDHPNFAEPSPADIDYFRDRIIEQLGSGDTFIQPYLYHDLAQYLARTDIINLSRNPAQANSLFYRFDNFLTRITHRCDNLAQGTRLRPETLRVQINHAMRMALQKLIDPCSVLLGNFQVYASSYCTTQCNFLNTVAQYFRTCGSSCSALQGGRCEGTVCMCNRILDHPFQGCNTNRMTSPMRLVHNSLRAKLTP